MGARSFLRTLRQPVRVPCRNAILTDSVYATTRIQQSRSWMPQHSSFILVLVPHCAHRRSSQSHMPPRYNTLLLVLVLLLTALSVWRALNLNKAAADALFPSTTNSTPLPEKPSRTDSLVLGDGPSNLFYFVQV